MRVACLNLCRPTPLMPKALATALIARSPFLGSTAVPLSVLGLLMTRCPLTRERVPRTRRRPLVRSASDLLSSAHHAASSWLPGCWRAFHPAPPSEVRYGLDGQVRNEGQRTMPGVRDLPADPLPARLSERRSMPGRRTSALSKVETDSALEGPRTKDVRRVTSPFAARVPVNAAGRAYGNWARPGSSADRASRGRSANVRLSGLTLIR